MLEEETTAWTMTRTEFLLARIAEDEVTERHVDRRYLGAGRWTEKVSHTPPSDRMLAECKAKRRIIALAVAAEGRVHDSDPMPEGSEWLLGQRQGATAALSVLTLVYVDHPDYHAVREGS